MTDAMRRLLETTAKLWGTQPYLVAGSGVDKHGCGLFAPVRVKIEVKHT